MTGKLKLLKIGRDWFLDYQESSQCEEIEKLFHTTVLPTTYRGETKRADVITALQPYQVEPII